MKGIYSMGLKILLMRVGSSPASPNLEKENKMKIGDQFYESVTIDEENEIEEVHLMQVSKIIGENRFEADDLGPVNENGCISAPWNKKLFPKTRQVSEIAWKIYAQSHGIYMEAFGNSEQQAVAQWNKRS